MRIYVAGPINAGNVIDVLNNIRRGIEATIKILKLKHSPFCPFLDFLFQFIDGTLTIEDYYRYSMSWLEVSDIVYVLPNSENSKGANKEIKRAVELGIPIVYDMKYLTIN